MKILQERASAFLENARCRRMKRRGPLRREVRASFLVQRTGVCVRNAEQLAGTGAVNMHTCLRTSLRSEAPRNVDLVGYVFGIQTIPVTVILEKMMIGLLQRERAVETVTQYRQIMAATARHIAEVRICALGLVQYIRPHCRGILFIASVQNDKVSIATVLHSRCGALQRAQCPRCPLASPKDRS